jgi:hypothetical protein
MVVGPRELALLNDGIRYSPAPLEILEVHSISKTCVYAPNCPANAGETGVVWHTVTKLDTFVTNKFIVFLLTKNNY